MRVVPDPRNGSITRSFAPLLFSMARTHSETGDIVAEPFLGSGTTLIAADRTGRRCYGMEIDPRYCRVAIARWEAFGGEKAERVNE